MKYPVLFAILPGAGCQLPITSCVQFPEAYVVGASAKALRLRLRGQQRWQHHRYDGSACGGFQNFTAFHKLS